METKKWYEVFKTNEDGSTETVATYDELEQAKLAIQGTGYGIDSWTSDNKYQLITQEKINNGKNS